MQGGPTPGRSRDKRRPARSAGFAQTTRVGDVCRSRIGVGQSWASGRHRANADSGPPMVSNQRVCTPTPPVSRETSSHECHTSVRRSSCCCTYAHHWVELGSPSSHPDHLAGPHSCQSGPHSCQSECDDRGDAVRQRVHDTVCNPADDAAFGMLPLAPFVTWDVLRRLRNHVAAYSPEQRGGWCLASALAKVVVNVTGGKPHFACRKDYEYAGNAMVTAINHRLRELTLRWRRWRRGRRRRRR